ncbi:hypothetical protein JZ751_023932 [Albula glossodonta]|uniref:Uncharacterized protein n=1 Tax=Albula glossodonta TaxID=121402 RepID=A0A8T2NSC3_9TELE|nr:hypothetical protein JZ751_023932 [Albula glossodonta]
MMDRILQDVLSLSVACRAFSSHSHSQPPGYGACSSPCLLVWISGQWLSSTTADDRPRGQQSLRTGGRDGTQTDHEGSGLCWRHARSERAGFRSACIMTRLVSHHATKQETLPRLSRTFYHVLPLSAV